MPNQAASSFLAGEIFLAPFSQSDLAGLLLLGEEQLPEDKEESCAFSCLCMTLLGLEPPHGAVRENPGKLLIHLQAFGSAQTVARKLLGKGRSCLARRYKVSPISSEVYCIIWMLSPGMALFQKRFTLPVLLSHPPSPFQTGNGWSVTLSWTQDIAQLEWVRSGK